jgi:hypothetical protein
MRPVVDSLGLLLHLAWSQSRCVALKATEPSAEVHPLPANPQSGIDRLQPIVQSFHHSKHNGGIGSNPLHRCSWTALLGPASAVLRPAEPTAAGISSKVRFSLAPWILSPESLVDLQAVFYHRLLQMLSPFALFLQLLSRSSVCSWSILGSYCNYFIVSEPCTTCKKCSCSSTVTIDYYF